MADVWTNSTPTVQRSTVASYESARCQDCQKPFWRAKGSEASHHDVDQTVSCAPDAVATTDQQVGRWARRAS